MKPLRILAFAISVPLFFVIAVQKVSAANGQWDQKIDYGSGWVLAGSSSLGTVSSLTVSKAGFNAWSDNSMWWNDAYFLYKVNGQDKTAGFTGVNLPRTGGAGNDSYFGWNTTLNINLLSGLTYRGTYDFSYQYEARDNSGKFWSSVYTQSFTISTGDYYAANSGASAITQSQFNGGESTLTGSVKLDKFGTGQINLTGNNNYTGTTTVNAGSLEVQTADSLGSTAAGTTVNSGAELRLWHASGVTVAAEGLTLNGDGIGGNGSLRNISGNNTWQGAISNNNGARINSDAGLLTISGNISNASGQTLYFGGAGNTAVSGQITGSKTTGDGTLFKNGAGTLTLSGNNSSSLTGTMVLRAGTVSVANANSLGSSGAIIIGTSGSANAVTLNVSDTTTRAGSLTVENTSTGGVVEVASGKTFTISGVLDQNGGTSLDTRFEKRGAGTLKLSGGTTGTFNGQIRISDGTLVAGSNGSLGDNVSTGPRALDLGINLSATASDKNVRIDLANGVNLNQSIYVGANQNSATRTLGMEGGAGSGTFQNEIYMDGALTLDPGASGTLTVSGKLTQNQSGASQAVTKTGAGTVILSGANDFKGGVNLNQGVLRLDTTTAAGTGTITQSSGASTLEVNTTGTVANQMSIYNVKTLQNVTLSGNKTLNNATYDVAASTTTTESGALSGSGGITKNGAGTLVVSGSSANTFTGASAVNAGILKLEKTGGATAISGTSIAINGGTLLLGAANQIANSTTVTLNGGILETAGHADAVGKLTVSGASTIKGLNDTSGSAFTFSDIDLSNYSTSSGSALTFVNSTGGNYSLGTVFQISTVAANSWTGYSETTLNNFSQKIQFGNGNVGQISFGSGISGTTLTVAAIPDARVYTAAAFLLVLIGVTEYRRRRKTVSSKV